MNAITVLSLLTKLGLGSNVLTHTLSCSVTLLIKSYFHLCVKSKSQYKTEKVLYACLLCLCAFVAFVTKSMLNLKSTMTFNLTRMIETGKWVQS